MNVEPLRLVRQWQDYVSLIEKAWQKCVTSILEVGHLLIEAKSTVPRNVFDMMLCSKFPFGPRTAQRLMAIAHNPVLANPTHGSRLPAAWRTLYELTQLPDPVLEQKIIDGTIHSKIERKEIIALIAEVKMKQRAEMELRAESQQSNADASDRRGSIARSIDAELIANPHRTDGAIADVLDGGNISYVGKRRRKLEASGEINVVPRAARTSPIRNARELKSFEKSIAFIFNACEHGAELEIPPLSPEVKTAALKRLKEAESALRILKRRLSEESDNGRLVQ